MTDVLPGNSEPAAATFRPARLAFWAAADKTLPMLYGVAMILVAFRVLDKQQIGTWAIFQTLFMIISLLAEFFILQPMVKLAAEHGAVRQPIVTASAALYTVVSLVLGVATIVLARPISILVKAPDAAGIFALMGWLVASNIVRNIAIRVLQIDYRIVAIFIVDLAYFVPLVGLMIVGSRNGTFDVAADLVDYNLIAFSVSSLTGLLFAARALRPSLRDFAASVRRVLELGVHQGGTGMLTVAQQQIDVLIVTGIRGPIATSIYFAAKTFYRFFDAVRDAAQLLLVPATSRAYSQERIEAVEEVTELATALLVLLMAPLSLGLILAAPVVVPLVVHLPEAVEEFQWLMANGFVFPFVIVPSAVLLGIGHTRDLFRGTFLGTVALVVAGAILTWFFGAVGMAIGVFVGTLTTAALLTRRMNRYVPFTFLSVLRRSRGVSGIVRRRLGALRRWNLGK